MDNKIYVLGIHHSDFNEGDNKTYEYIGDKPEIDSEIFLLNTQSQTIFAKVKIISSNDKEIKFNVIEIRGKGNEIPTFTLLYHYPNYMWPKSHVCKCFQSILYKSLMELWSGTCNQSQIEQVLSCFTVDKGNNSWYRDYKNFVEWFKNLNNTYLESDLIKIWCNSDSISSISPANISESKCAENVSELREITSLISSKLDEKTHEEVKARWLPNTTFTSIMHASINRVFAMSDPEHFTSVVSEKKYFPKLYKYLADLLPIDKNYKNWASANIAIKSEINKLVNKDSIELNVLLWELAEYLYDNNDRKITFEDVHRKDLCEMSKLAPKIERQPINQILYGPPGTGKTFHTIEAAVKAAEPTFYLDLNIDQLKGVTQEQRAQLQSKFKELSDSKRIRFVTFHQSYGYEEFVEGLKAECNDEGQISYCVEAGIFKQICQDAKSSNAEHQQFDSALEKLKELCSDEQNPLRVKTSNKSEFDVVYRGGKTFLLDPVSAGRSCGYSASLENIKKLYLTGNKDSIYNISYVRGLLEYMREHLNLAPISQHEKQIQPYVLVIDEINRGNISKIFGELITLIEPSKRKGAEEALEVTLPYSGDIFSVPDNLHIIGTMNTADRSLAMMDTALRRRFDFVEMMPKPELFKNRKIRNIDLTKLLTTLNNRIEVLYDREHTLGHAFLFPVYNEQDEDKAFQLLKSAFKNKIIPLLEEYFFDDWNKIRLVLGDNQKEAALCFVTKHEDNYESLFGADHGLNLYEDAKVTFQLASFDGDDSVWDRPEAYIAIYTKG